MSIGRRDYILRMIEQFGEFLARLVSLKAAGKHAEAMKELDDMLTQLFGSQKSMLNQVDTKTAAMLLGDGYKVVVYAWLLRQQGDVYEAQADHAVARAAYRRALELATIAEGKGGVFDSSRTLLLQIATDLPDELLDEKLRAARDTLLAKVTS
jgi:tetratricopeptide (TPR) repeat protein